MIDEVIGLINNGFDGLDAEEIILGLATRVYRQSSDENIDYLPGIVNAQGEAVYAGIDDVKSLMIYHKTNSAGLSFVARSGYGDGIFNSDTISCSIIATWDTRKIPLQHADMLLILRSRLPQQIVNFADIKKIDIQATGAILNSKQVFDAEYSFDKNYLLPIYINLIQINYSLILKYDQQCIDKCINCKK